MHTFTDVPHKRARALAALAIILGCLGIADRALASGGSNATNAKLCQHGAWSKLMDGSAHGFAGQDACVSYAAHGGAIYARATLSVTACEDQPYDGLCVDTSGAGLEPGSVAHVVMTKNGSAVREEWPVVQGDGTFAPSPSMHFEFPCVAGNVYAANATGTSAASLTSPTAPGIPISSATVQRTSVCP